MGRRKNNEKTTAADTLTEELVSLYKGKNSKETVAELEKKYPDYKIQQISFGSRMAAAEPKLDRIRVWDDKNGNVSLVYVG